MIGKRQPKGPELPPGPNPHANDPIHVEPFGQAWAVVECLGVISAHQEKHEAEEALKAELERRALAIRTGRDGRDEALTRRRAARHTNG